MPQSREIVEAKKKLRKATKKLPPHVLDKVLSDIKGMNREEMIKYFTEISGRG